MWRPRPATCTDGWFVVSQSVRVPDCSFVSFCVYIAVKDYTSSASLPSTSCVELGLDDSSHGSALTGRASPLDLVDTLGGTASASGAGRRDRHDGAVRMSRAAGDRTVERRRAPSCVRAKTVPRQGSGEGGGQKNSLPRVVPGPCAGLLRRHGRSGAVCVRGIHATPGPHHNPCQASAEVKADPASRWCDNDRGTGDTSSPLSTPFCALMRKSSRWHESYRRPCE